MKELYVTNRVRNSSEFIYQNMKHVKIDFDKLDELTTWISEYKYDEFDQSSSHPNKDEMQLEENLLFIFLVDTLNFCFWPHKMEYEDLTQFIKDNINSGLFSIDYFVQISYEDFNLKFSELFKENSNKSMYQRFFNAKELCCFVKDKFQSKFINIIQNGEFDCEKILDIITQNLTSFQDHAVYKGRLVYFYKRAQILVGDLNEVLKIQHKSSTNNTNENLQFFETNTNLKNIESLTCFADYRVPQVLHYFGALKYKENLEQKIKQAELLQSGSEEEIEIRGAMIYSITYLQQQIQKKLNKKMLEIEIDWVLWQYGEKNLINSHPYHKTLGVFY